MESQFKGLTTHQFQLNLKTYGSNVIKSHKESALQTFLKQFLSPLIYLLLIAAALSFLLSDNTDGVIILVIIVVNSLLGFFQQYRVNKEFEKLSSFITSTAIVLRDDEKKTIKKSQIVPDDIIFLKLGDIIPADCFVLEQDELTVDESALTGESTNVTKVVNLNENKSLKEGILYSGTNIISGSAVAKVFATGENSEFGSIAELSLQTKKISEYEVNLKNLSKKFLIVSLVALGAIFITHLIFRHEENLVDLLLFTIAISITIIPEALPVVANLTLSRSAFKLGKDGVIVKRAAAVEDLGNIDLICSDKTGTLTKNINEVTTMFVGKSKEEFFKYAYLLSQRSEDQLDVAMQKYLQFNHFEPNTQEKSKLYDKFKDIPFDPVKKSSSREFKDFTIVKGASEYVMELTKFKDKDFEEMLKTNEENGLRAISLALVEGAKSKYLGTFFLSDEIKDDVANVIKRAENLGIKIKIITGDSTAVSRFVGKKVGLIKSDDEVIESKDLKFDSGAFFEEQVFAHTIFTRCDPVQKYKILEALQKKHFLGYLGDGINDSPSLKLANVSIVVNSASDIAKEDADLVLLTKNLKVLIEGVSQGRIAFENIDKYLRQTLVGNFGNFITIGVISVFINYLPMLPIQILISNLLTDIPSLAISSDNVERDVVKLPKYHDLNNLVKHAFFFAAVSCVFDFMMFIILSQYPAHTVQSTWFIYTTISEILLILSLRTKRVLWHKKQSLPSRTLVLAILTSFAIIMAIGLLGSSILSTDQLTPGLFVLIFALTGGYFIVNEIFKKLIYLKLNK